MVALGAVALCSVKYSSTQGPSPCTDIDCLQNTIMIVSQEDNHDNNGFEAWAGSVRDV